jgi:pilus assembly protein Flp/PilA
LFKTSERTTIRQSTKETSFRSIAHRTHIDSIERESISSPKQARLGVIMFNFLRTLQRDERGVSSMEYAVLAGIIVIAIVAVGTVVQNGTTGIPGLFSNLMTAISGHIHG